jgi:hypothetical protein
VALFTVYSCISVSVAFGHRHVFPCPCVLLWVVSDNDFAQISSRFCFVVGLIVATGLGEAVAAATAAAISLQQPGIRSSS